MRKRVEIQPSMMSNVETQALIDDLSKKMKRNGKYVIAASLCIVACTPMSILFPEPFSMFLGCIVAFLFFIMVPVLIVGLGRINKKLKKIVGENLACCVLQEVFEVETYSAHDHLEKDFIKKMKLISGWDTISGGHLVSGKYKGRSIIFSEIKLEHREAGDDGRYYTIFHGPWIIIEHAQTLSSPVWVMSDMGKGTKRKCEPDNVESRLQLSLVNASGSAADVTPTPDLLKLLESFCTVIPETKYMTFYENKVCIAINYGRSIFGYSTRDLKDINELKGKFRTNTNFLIDILNNLINIYRYFD